MNIFPAIDLYESKVVRLMRGDYAQMTIYSEDPVAVARSFYDTGAEYLHVVDLEGAKTGQTPNFEIIRRLIAESGLKVEVGGGIRSMETIARYVDAGVFRVILGTAALTDPDFLQQATKKYGDIIGVGVDIKDGFVAIKGWTELSDTSCMDFCQRMQGLGIKTIICTDISKDGMLAGTNLDLYKQLNEQLNMQIVASGGVSSLDDVCRLRDMGMYGAILGRALYTGDLELAAALQTAKEVTA